jgi:uncharacterized protein YndB with AHSA1/START domain
MTHMVHVPFGSVLEFGAGDTMEFETTVEINATPEQVWNTLIAVERWPEWTASITAVEPLDSDQLKLGTKVRIKQPRMPALVWEITKFEPGVSFDWVASSPGVKTVAAHRITAVDNARVLVTHAIHQSGAFAPIAALLTAGTTRRYVQMEANGLKLRSEAAESTHA